MFVKWGSIYIFWEGIIHHLCRCLQVASLVLNTEFKLCPPHSQPVQAPFYSIMRIKSSALVVLCHTFACCVAPRPSLVLYRQIVYISYSNHLIKHSLLDFHFFEFCAVICKYKIQRSYLQDNCIVKTSWLPPIIISDLKIRAYLSALMRRRLF